MLSNYLQVLCIRYIKGINKFHVYLVSHLLSLSINTMKQNLDEREITDTHENICEHRNNHAKEVRPTLTHKNVIPFVPTSRNAK